jgi:hypothetical protein
VRGQQRQPQWSSPALRQLTWLLPLANPIPPSHTLPSHTLLSLTLLSLTLLSLTPLSPILLPALSRIPLPIPPANQELDLLKQREGSIKAVTFIVYLFFAVICQKNKTKKKTKKSKKLEKKSHFANHKQSVSFFLFHGFEMYSCSS